MKKIILLAVAVILSACQEAPGGYTPGPLAFESQALTPIRINVHEIRVVDGYQSPMQRPNMEQDFPVSPAQAVHKWVSQRLQSNPAISANSLFEVTIEDASVKEVALPKTKGVKGLFTDDQDTRYDAKLVVTFKLFGGGATRAMSDAMGTIEISRSRTINEKATVVQRQQLYHQMTNEMMVSFETEANKRLRQYFGSYLQ